MNDCIFCKIVKKEIPKELHFEDENIVAFDDINPQSEVHVLFIPKKHFDSLDLLSDGDDMILSSVRKGIKKVVEEKGLNGKGYKVLVYAGGAQTIDHLHFHLRGPLGLKV